jgi:hypothetical protein
VADEIQIEKPLKNAGAIGRGSAFMFDLFFCILVAQLVGGVILVATRGDVEKNFTIYLTSSGIVAFALIFLQEVFLKTTFGKIVLGLSIESSNGKPLTKPRLLLHSILKILWIIDFLVIAFSKNKTSLANRLSKTRVLWTPRSPILRTGLFSGGILLIALLFAGAFFVSGLTYGNTAIVAVAQETLDRIIQEQSTPEKGTLNNPHHAPLQVVIRNEDGLVSLEYFGPSNETKYVNLLFSKRGEIWEFVKGEVVIDKPSPNFSITYSKMAGDNSGN